MKVLRIRQPAALLLPVVNDLLREAFGSDVMVKDPNAAMAELSGQLHRDDLGLFIAGDEKGWYGVLLAQWSKSAFNTGCVVIHFYNKSNNKASRHALLEALVDYAKEGGYDSIIGVDTNDKPHGFAKLFRVIGEPKFTGQLVVFDMNESLI